MIIITVTQDNKTTTGVFTEDKAGTDKSVKWLEAIKKKHFQHPNSYLFPEIEKMKKKIYARRLSYYEQKHYANKVIDLERDRERYFKQKLDDCKPPKLTVNIEHLWPTTELSI